MGVASNRLLQYIDDVAPCLFRKHVPSGAVVSRSGTCRVDAGLYLSSGIVEVGSALSLAQALISPRGPIGPISERMKFCRNR